MISEPADVVAPRLRALLADSWRVLRAHPVVSAALGGAVVLSLASMLFGIGVIVTPWFVCEVFALQIAVLTGEPTQRTTAWLRAALLSLGMFGVVAAATWVAVLAIGPDVSTADSAAGPLPWPDAAKRVAFITAVTALTVGFIAPFSYAPLILIDRGGRAGEAVLESAWLVRRGGLLRHWALTFLAHLLPFAPAIVAAVVVARTFERAATPIGVLLGLPLLPLTIPLGQGLLSAAYVLRRRELPERRWTRAEASPPIALRMALICAVLAPMLGVVMLAAGALRPSPVRPGVGRGELVLAETIEGPTEMLVPETTLAVHVDGTAMSIRAGDGGGTGRIAPQWRGAIERVRVLRRRERYDVELAADARTFVVRVDRAAVRVDDSVGTRLVRRLPAWALPAMALAFASSALLLVHGLEPLGGIRRAYGAPADRRAPVAVLRVQRRASLRRAWIVAALLLPVALAALAGGLLALFG